MLNQSVNRTQDPGGNRRLRTRPYYVAVIVSKVSEVISKWRN